MKFSKKLFLSLFTFTLVFNNVFLGAPAAFADLTSAADTLSIGANSEIRDFVTGSDGTTYFIGSFTEVGTKTGMGVPIVTSTAAKLSGFSQVAGSQINVVIPDGSNGWYIGGYFTQVGSTTIRDVAHINSDGTIDTAFDPVLAGGTGIGVKDMVLIGSTLYVAGDFTSVNSTARKKLAAITTTNGELVSGFNASLGDFDSVYALDKSGDDATLYVGGSFASCGGSTRNNICAVSPTNGTATTWNADANSWVTEIRVSGSTIYVGGSFTTIAGQSRAGLGAVDTSATATSWNPNPTFATINVIRISGSTIYVGGMFSSIGGQTRNNIVALNNSNGNATAWNANADMTVNDIQVSGSSVYLAGSFTTVGGTSRPGVALVNDATGALDTSWNASSPATVNSIALSGSNMYVGGSFNLFGSDRYTRNKVAAIDSTGAVTSWNPNPSGDSGTVSAIEISGSTIYLGGSFTSIGGGSQSNLASINTSGTLIAGWNPQISSDVTALELSGTTLFLAVSAMSHTCGGASRGHYSGVSTSNASCTTFNPVGTVTGGGSDTLCTNTDTIFAGGNIGTIDGQSREKMASWTMSSNAITSWNPASGGFPMIYKLVCDGTTIYVGGSFTSMGGQDRNNLASVGTSGTGTATTWNPNMNGGVRTIAVTSSKVYAGGDFTQAGGSTTRNYLAEFNKSTGALNSWNPNLSNSVYSLYHNGTSLFAGGTFNLAGSTYSPYIAKWSEPTIAFTSATGTGAESTTSVNIGVSLSTTVSGDATVNYSVTGGTATGSGTDYTLASGTATISSGTTTSIPLTIVNDALDETASETIIVTLASPSSNVSLGTNTTFTYTITDDDASPTVGFTSASSSGAESAGSVNLPISLSAASSFGVTVNYAATGGTATSGSDYTLASGTATIAAGATSTTVPMSITNDATEESAETVIITLSSPTNSTLATSTYTYTINNDDTSDGGGGAVFSVSSSSSGSGGSGSGSDATTDSTTDSTDDDDSESDSGDTSDDDDDSEETDSSPEPETEYIPPQPAVEPAPPQNTERAQAETKALKKAASATTNYITQKVSDVVTPEAPVETSTNPDILNAIETFESVPDITVPTFDETDSSQEDISTETEATLDQVLAGEVTETLDMAKVELSVGEEIQTEVQKALSTIIIPVEEAGTVNATKKLKVKVGNKTQEVDELTKFKFSFSYEDAKVLRKGYEIDNVVVGDPGTDMDGDGLSDVWQITNKIPMFNPDPDNDSVEGADEIFFAGNPTKFDSFAELVPQTPRITNMNNTEVGLDPVFWIAGEVGDKFTVHIVDAKTKSKVIKVGEGEIGNNFKAALNVNLRDGEWYVFVKDEDGIGKISRIKANSKLSLSAPDLKKTGKDSAKSTSVAYAMESTEDGGTLITGFTQKGAKIYVTWKSTIFNSVVVADASSGYFELHVPDKLEDGDHEVLAYIVDERNNWTSSVSSLIFNRIRRS